MRNCVVAPAAITLDCVDGEPKVPAVPASPVLTTTVTPARTAASFAREMGSLASSGNGLPPKDSLITSTSSCSTAYSMACTKLDVVLGLICEKTFKPTSEAPGAMPRMRILHGDGNG